jgi:Bacterial PH domain
MREHTLWRPQRNLPVAALYLVVGAAFVAGGYSSVLSMILGGALGLAILAVGVRRASVRVVLRPDGIAVCNLRRTYQVPWARVVAVDRPDPNSSRPTFRLVTVDGRLIRMEAFPQGRLKYHPRYGDWADLIDRTRVERAGPLPPAMPLPTV